MPLNKVLHDHFILDKDNNVRNCTLLEWIIDRSNIKRNIVNLGLVDDKLISTFFLGIDNDHDGISPHKVFETMIFPLKTDRSGDDYIDRYSTWDEALAGHEKAVQWVKDGCKK